MQKQKRKKITGIFLIIYVISLGMSWGYFFYQQDTNYDKRVIQQFSSSNTEFSDLYKVENRRLVNVAQESYIFPTDRLEYRFTIVNPLDHPIRVTYDFEVFRTGERIHDESGEWYFQNNDVEHRQFEFSLPDEGRYDLKANWIFYNETNGEKYAQFAPLDRDVQVLSLANKLQMDSNQLTFQGLFAASIVGVGTVIALILSVFFSKKEVNLLESQIRIENRAWIAPIDIVPKYVTFEDGTSIDFDIAEEMIRERKNKSHSINRVFEIAVKNSGKRPARVRGRMIHNTEKIGLTELEKTHSNIFPIIMPNEFEYFSVDLNRDYLINGGVYYVGILLEYDIDDKKVAKIGKIWEIHSSVRKRILEHIVDPDIVEK